MQEANVNKNENISPNVIYSFFTRGYIYSSKKKIGNMSLVDVNFKFNEVAKGFAAIGFISKGSKTV